MNALTPCPFHTVKQSDCSRCYPPPQPEDTFWNGERTPCLRGTLEVTDDGTFPEYWARNLIGQRIQVVLVDYYGDRFYLDNRDGEGWRKVTEGGGGPRMPHKSVTGKYFELGPPFRVE